MKHIWSVLCEKSIVDAQKNTISLIDVLEQLNVSIPSDNIAKIDEGPITIQVNFELVSFWMKDEDKQEKDEEVIVSIEAYGPDNRKLKSFDQSIKIPAGYKRIRSRSLFTGLSIFESGVHKIKIKFRDNEQGGELRVVAELPLDIALSIPMGKKVA